MRPQKPRHGWRKALTDFFKSIGQSDVARADASEARTGAEVVADFLGLSSVGSVYRYTDPDQPGGEISFGAVCDLAERFRCSEAAEHLARLSGGVFVKLEAPEACGSQWQQSFQDMLTDFAGIGDGLTRALAHENDVDADEVKRFQMIEAADALIAEAVTYRERLKRVASAAKAGA